MNKKFEEPFTHVIVTTWGLVVAVRESELFFFKVLNDLNEQNRISKADFLSAEANMLKYRYHWFDRRKRGKRKPITEAAT